MNLTPSLRSSRFGAVCALALSFTAPILLAQTATLTGRVTYSRDVLAEAATAGRPA